MSGKPNILFLIADDQRFDTIGALGNPDIRTPNLDRLVMRAASFTHAHIPGGTSGAVCMPSRAMFNTGRTLFHIENEGQNIPSTHTTLGEAFRNAGYTAFGTGKWHNGTASYARSFNAGGSIFFGGMWDHWNVPVCHYDPSGRYGNTVDITPDFFYGNRTVKVNCDTIRPGYHSTELISDTAKNFIENYGGQDPFLCYVSFMAPHDPRTMPEKFKRMYDPEKIKLPPNYMPEHSFDFGIRDIRDEVLAPYPRTETEVKRHTAEYYAMISHLDDAVGGILETLEKKGLTGNTIVVFTGDNGLAVGQHGLMGKQNHYEHSIRVPLIFAGPGIPQGQRIDNYAYLLDILPTLCGLCGIPVPPSVEGNDLTPMMRDPSVKLRETLYFAYTDQIRSVKDNRYKLIEYSGKYTGTQLFDLRQDPCELNDLASDTEYKDVKNRLRKELFRLRDQWEDIKHPYGKSFWDCYDKNTRGTE